MVVPFVPTLRHSRPMSSPRADSVSFSLYPVYPRSMRQSRELKKAAERPKTRWVLVDGSLFEVPEKFFTQMPPKLRDYIQFTSGGGATSKKPIRLDRHSNQEFRRLLDAYNAYNLYISATIKTITLDHLLTVGSFACVYQMRAVQEWFLPVFRGMVLSPDTLLRSATNDLYVRFLRIALSYRDLATTRSITIKWVSKLHLGELNPLTAICFAELHCLTYLLANGYYVYLMTVARRIQGGLAFGSTGAPTRRQRTHILAGYYSLRTYWRTLCADPLAFEAADGCGSHTLCVKGWGMRWMRVAGRPCPLPEVDVIGRTLLVEKALANDTVLGVYMSPACRALALKAVAAKRDRISKQLHHHFDL